MGPMDPSQCVCTVYRAVLFYVLARDDPVPRAGMAVLQRVVLPTAKDCREVQQARGASQGFV